MAKDNRDYKAESEALSLKEEDVARQSEELRLERERLAALAAQLTADRTQHDEQRTLLAADLAEHEVQRQRLGTEWDDLKQQQAELRDSSAAAPAEPAAPPAPSNQVIMHVLKKFRFQYPMVTRGGELELVSPGAERWFDVGENRMDTNDPRDACVLNHPWIKDHLADGRIEHPQATLDRLKAMSEQAKHRDSATRAAIEQVQNALKQHVSFSNKNQADADAFMREMNTPLNKRHLLS